MDNDRQLKLPFLYKIEETIEPSTAARIAQVSEETVRRWCDEGKIPAYKMVGRWRIERARFLDWLEALRRGERA